MGWSHPGVTTVTQEMVTSLSGKTDNQVEFYSESLDSTAFSDETSQREARDWLAYKYRNIKLDVIVAAGPEPLKFLAKSATILFPKVPIVFCAAPEESITQAKLDSRFTGTWLKLDPSKTVEVALQLFPGTQHFAVVAGTSEFDKEWFTVTRAGLRAYETRFDFTYLTDLEMNKLLDRLRRLPEHTVVLYTTYFRDAAGSQYVNATYVLPLISRTANAPVFGMADTYLGHGIVGGYVLSFDEQGKIAAQIVSEILSGKKAEEIPIVPGQSLYAFDWHELRRWHIKESALPPDSTVLFRELSVWERTWWIWTLGLLIILGLSASAGYLQYNRKQLKLAKDSQLHLTGRLISAQEKERSRLASELHDDFSQRLAILSLGLETAAEAMHVSPQEASRQLHELLNSASEIGADLHTLSHRLHSSTLESLGLVPGISALCKEFSSQQGIEVDFSSEDIPHLVHPDVALCLFRIVQEGLRNLKKHSRAAWAQVSLRRDGETLNVTVRDEGLGFDPRELRNNGGLGIRSMEERAHLLGGRFEIHSQLGKGTTVEAWVPLQPESRVVHG